MKTEEVKKLSPLDRFLYWCRERQNIYLRKQAGQPKPWTDDEILQQYYFTNVYREQDKVTVWFRENIREPLRNDIRVLFATIVFRWFNLPATANILAELPWTEHEGNLLLNWNAEEVLVRLSEVRSRGIQVFTGAYMVNSPPGSPKLEAVITRISKVWDDIENLNRRAMTWKTLQQAHIDLMRYEGLGGFGAYEVVTDLRWTYLLQDATDIDTWANPGPGCSRGLCRILGIPFPKGDNSTAPKPPAGYLGEMKKLLDLCNKRLRGMPRFEMREIEHTLCEWDKSERALWQDGKLKRRYNGK